MSAIVFRLDVERDWINSALIKHSLLIIHKPKGMETMGLNWLCVFFFFYFNNFLIFYEKSYLKVPFLNLFLIITVLTI